MQLTIGDEEFGRLLFQLFDLALLVHPIGLLVVNEQLGGALAAHPFVEELLVISFLKGLLHKG